jgi:hypothetical protein
MRVAPGHSYLNARRGVSPGAPRRILMSMTISAVVTALIGVLGVTVGAWVQQFFTRRLDERRQLRELRARACIDFIKALSDLAHANRLQRADAMATRDLSDAKARIAIYGSRRVVAAMAAFLREHHVLGPEAAGGLVRLAAAMRHDTAHSEAEVDVEELRVLLLGS